MLQSTILKNLLNNFRIELSKLGCGSNSCHFNPPKRGYIGTNGSCHCLDSIHDWEIKNTVVDLYRLIRVKESLREMVVFEGQENLNL